MLKIVRFDKRADKELIKARKRLKEYEIWTKNKI